ncbi:MAG: PilT/PilU family type 4a pilus ATPase [Verrucomicrobia bacterium]|jgi:twitching motility protein PilT|nr:PilT/PilU family type 4a pilus ATPase [Verrucomicrobiota bacterium]
MNLEELIGQAAEQGGSDLHLEPGYPAAIRVRGSLRCVGAPIGGRDLTPVAQELVGDEEWPVFLERGSADLSRTIGGVRCRINLFRTSRGIGFAIRLLADFEASLDRLNLHPDLTRWTHQTSGLILVSGPTGSGKSSTLAALIHEINTREARHIVTIESPIEYTFRPRMAYIRQREVGRDTPSFEQALLDALREDPDVLMVGEMRDPETMRLTLNAAETGHLVLATVHSSSCVEALQRVVSAFPAEIQSSVAAQLADCLAGVICQRLQYRPDLRLRLPECEMLVPTHAVKNFIRIREFFRIVSVMETGAEHGMWTFERYRNWMSKRANWTVPPRGDAPSAERVAASPEVGRAGVPPRLPPVNAARESGRGAARPGPSSEGRIEIEPVAGGLDAVLRKLK